MNLQEAFEHFAKTIENRYCSTGEKRTVQYQGRDYSVSPLKCDPGWLMAITIATVDSEPRSQHSELMVIPDNYLKVEEGTDLLRWSYPPVGLQIIDQFEYESGDVLKETPSMDFRIDLRAGVDRDHPFPSLHQDSLTVVMCEIILAARELSSPEIELRECRGVEDTAATET